MKDFSAYNIPIRGMKDKIYQFDYQLDNQFFESFEDSLIKQGDVKVELYFDKRPDLFVLAFEIKGTVNTVCDRCLEDFDLAIHESHQLLLKLEENREVDDEADIEFIASNLTVLNIRQYLYEYTSLSLPMIKTHPEDETGEPTCNPEVMKYLNAESETEESEPVNPIWADLAKKLKDK